MPAAKRAHPSLPPGNRVRAATPAGTAARLGHALSEAGRHEDALAVLCPAAARQPGDPDLLLGIGTVLLRLARPQQAVGALLLAVEASPGDARALSALGVAFLHCGDLQQAGAYAAAAYQIAPDHGNAVNLSRVLLEAGAFGEALAVSAAGIALHPGSMPARNNHALALEGLGRHSDAVAAWQDALAMAPGDADVCHKLATLLLALGRMTPETWALYERRLDGRVGPGTVRRWHGEDVAGKTVLLHAEQGLGDTMQFVRYAPMVAALGAKVVLAVQPSLVRLLDPTPGVAQVVAAGGALPSFDVFCPLLSLPALFRTTLDTIPPPLAYRLPFAAPAPGGLHVGLVWAGNPGFVNDRARSIPPGLLATLVQVPGIRLHSLQLGCDTMPDPHISDAMAGVGDFADTARRVATMDLVIAVDTAVAHLAATMGKPVWLLSRHLGCWRWLFGRTDSPWYPTVRLYRQPAPNDWPSVIEQVRSDLHAVTLALPRSAAWSLDTVNN